MPSYEVSIELGDLIPPNVPFTADLFPALAYAVRRMGAYAHQDWVEYAMGKPLPSGLVVNNRTGTYARSIQFKETGPFSVEVFSTLPYAAAIEQGTRQRDMKEMLNSSAKVRLTKSGKRYLIIPFRHEGRNLPEAVAEFFRRPEAKPSFITGTYRRNSGTGAFGIRSRALVTVPGWRYSWGDRLDKGDLAGMGVHGKDAKRLTGLVNFRNPGGERGGGAAKGSHSQLITFRKMVEGSKGWIAKAQPGKFPAKTVGDLLRPLAEEAFAAAVEADVRAMIAGS